MTLPSFLASSDFRKLKITAAIFVIVSFAILGTLIIILQRQLQPSASEKKARELTNSTTIQADGETIELPPEIGEIIPEDLNLLLLQKDPPKIVHVASALEWQGAHLPDSTYLDPDNFAAPPNTLGQNENIVLISKDGVEAVLMAEKLINNFAFNRYKIRSLKGGLVAWEEKGFKVER